MEMFVSGPETVLRGAQLQWSTSSSNILLSCLVGAVCCVLRAPALVLLRLVISTALTIVLGAHTARQDTTLLCSLQI